MKYLLPLFALSFLLAACSSTQPRRQVWAEPEADAPQAQGSSLAQSPEARRDLWKEAVNTPDATRRSLYSPSKASGPYTTMLQDGSWKHGSRTADEEVRERPEQQAIQQMKSAGRAGP